MKNVILFLLIIFSFNIQAEYLKKEEIIAGDKIVYLESKDGELYDSFFTLKEKQDTEILYFFSYNCSSCYAFKDYFSQAEDFFNKKKNIRLEKIPLFLENNTINYFNAELFFWRKMLGFNKDFDSLIFDLIHKEKISIQSKDDIESLLINYALVEEKDLKNINNNKKIKYRLNKSKEISKTIKVNSTPTIIIHKNGKRYLINATDSGTPYNMLVSLIYILEYK